MRCSRGLRRAASVGDGRRAAVHAGAPASAGGPGRVRGAARLDRPHIRLQADRTGGY